MALWGGRFASETRDEVAKYTESLRPRVRDAYRWHL